MAEQPTSHDGEEKKAEVCKHAGTCRICNGVKLSEVGQYFFTGAVSSESVEKVRKEVSEMIYTRHLKVRDGENAPQLSDRVTVMMESGGGSCWAGLSLYSTLQRLQRETGIAIDVHVEGICASMATSILQAGAVRIASAEAIFMLHEVSYGTYGKLFEHEEFLDETRRLEKQLASIYARRNTKGYTDPQWWIRRLRRKDWWLPADEALKYGLIDAIV